MKKKEIGQCKYCKFCLGIPNARYQVCKNKYAKENLYMMGMTKISFGCWYWKVKE